MHPETWQLLLSRLKSTEFFDPNQLMLISHIPTLSVNQRTELIRLARSPVIPLKGTTVYGLLHRSLSEDMISNYSSLLYSHMARMVLLWASRNAPLGMEDILLQKRASFMKEFSLTQKSRPRPKLNFSCFFSDSTQPIHPDIPFNGIHARLVRNVIDQWLRWCTSNIFYPRLSSKTTSVDTSKVVKGHLHSSDPVSQVTLESLWVNEAIQFSGVSEIRQRYYQSQFDPRTYFSAGGDAFFKTRFIQRMCAQLCDLIPSCNRYLRTQPNRLRIEKGQYAIAYDLTSFTSSLADQVYFLDCLSEYCMGSLVECYDGRYRHHVMDLGLLFKDLADAHRNPEFISTLPELRGYRGSLDLGGFLGVYGNITIATFIHAIVMLQVSFTDQLNVAGDDGLIVVDDNHDLVVRAIETLGTLNKEKIYRTDEPGCISLKRSVFQSGQSLFFHPNLVAPSLEYSLSSLYIDPRYSEIHRMTKREKKSAAASSVSSFLSSLLVYHLSSEEAKLAESICSLIYEQCGLPKEGHVPQISGKKLSFVPRIAPFCSDRDPVDYTLSSLYTSIALVQLRDSIPFQDSLLQEDSFICNSHPKLAYLVKIGHVSEEPLKVLVSGKSGLQCLRDEYANRGSVVSRYVQIKASIN